MRHETIGARGEGPNVEGDNALEGSKQAVKVVNLEDVPEGELDAVQTYKKILREIDTEEIPSLSSLDVGGTHPDYTLESETQEVSISKFRGDKTDTSFGKDASTRRRIEGLKDILERSKEKRPDLANPYIDSLFDNIRVLHGDISEVLTVDTGDGHEYYMQGEGEKLGEGAQGSVYNVKMFIENPQTADLDAMNTRGFEVGRTIVKIMRVTNDQEALSVRAEVNGADNAGVFAGLEMVSAKDANYAMIIMEKIGGRDGEKFIKENKEKLQEPEGRAYAVSSILPIAHGVKLMHDRGVAHRDIKPANMLIDGEGSRLIDYAASFGFAEDGKVKDETLRTVIGSPMFMTYGAMRGRVDMLPDADVYALATSLLLMIDKESVDFVSVAQKSTGGRQINLPDLRKSQVKNTYLKRFEDDSSKELVQFLHRVIRPSESGEMRMARVENGETVGIDEFISVISDIDARMNPVNERSVEGALESEDIKLEIYGIESSFEELTHSLESEDLEDKHSVRLKTIENLIERAKISRQEGDLDNAVEDIENIKLVMEIMNNNA